MPVWRKLNGDLRIQPTYEELKLNLPGYFVIISGQVSSLPMRN